MLSKIQFNAAVKRLREQFTVKHLASMLLHHLKRHNGDEYEELKKSLLTLSGDKNLASQTPLDRRRAENYLSNSLYGRDHNKVVHLMTKPDHKASDLEFATRAKWFGVLVESLACKAGWGSDGIDNYAKSLAKRLRATSIEDFHVSIRGLRHHTQAYGMERFNGWGNFNQHDLLIYMSFLDLEIKCEAVYTWDITKPRERPDDHEYFYLDVTINGLDLEQYSKTLDDVDSNELESIFLLFAMDIVEIEYEPSGDFYCSRFPKELMDKHEWRSKRDPFTISGRMSKQHLLYGVYSGIEKELERTDDEHPVISQEVLSVAKSFYGECAESESCDALEMEVIGFSLGDRESAMDTEGSIIFYNPSTKDKVEIGLFYYNVDNDLIDVTELDIRLNRKLIASVVPSDDINDPWAYLKRDLEKYIPFVRRNQLNLESIQKPPYSTM